MSQHHLAQFLDTVPDFPKPGIMFSDISPLLKTHFKETIDAVSYTHLTLPTSVPV